MRQPFAPALAAALLCAALAAPVPQASAFRLGGLFGSPVDPEIAAQVPQDQRSAINAADYDLACANQDVELAKLKEELAEKQDDLAALGTSLAKSQARGAEIRLDIAKMQAIIANKLGNTEDNQKIMTDLSSDQAKNDAETRDYQSKIGTATLFVRDWTQRVAAKEKSVAAFKARRTGGVVPAASPAAAATSAGAASSPAASSPAATGADNSDDTVITHSEPGAAPQPQPSATPEADLNN